MLQSSAARSPLQCSHLRPAQHPPHWGPRPLIMRIITNSACISRSVQAFETAQYLIARIRYKSSPLAVINPSKLTSPDHSKTLIPWIQNNFQHPPKFRDSEWGDPRRVFLSPFFNLRGLEWRDAAGRRRHEGVCSDLWLNTGPQEVEGGRGKGWGACKWFWLDAQGAYPILRTSNVLGSSSRPQIIGTLQNSKRPPRPLFQKADRVPFSF